jgi:transposase
MMRAHRQAPTGKRGPETRLWAFPRWTDHQNPYARRQPRPLPFILTAGQVGEVAVAPTLLEGFQASAGLADEAYDNNVFRQIIADTGAETVIASNRTCKIDVSHNPAIYRQCNRIERCFNKLKHFRSSPLATILWPRNFLADIHLAAAMIRTR